MKKKKKNMSDFLTTSSFALDCCPFFSVINGEEKDYSSQCGTDGSSDTFTRSEGQVTSG